MVFQKYYNHVLRIIWTSNRLCDNWNNQCCTVKLLMLDMNISKQITETFAKIRMIVFEFPDKIM